MIDYKNTAFEKGEYELRVLRVQNEMARRGIELLLVHEIGNICWLCGIQCLCWNKYFMLAVPQKGDPVLVIQSFELYNAYLGTWLDEAHIVPYYSCEIGKPDEDPLDVSVRTIKERGFEKAMIGLELSTSCPGISASGFEKIMNGLRKAGFTDASGLVERIRAVKMEAELRYIRQAADISSLAMTTVMDQAEAGMTDNDLAAIAHQVMAKNGSEIHVSGSDHHHRPAVRHSPYHLCAHKINKGDTGLLEFGACINRYTGVTMRAVSFGEPDDDVKVHGGRLHQQHHAIIENAKPGAVCHDVAVKAEEKLAKHLERYMWHGLYGYSIGLGFPPRWDDCGDLFIKKNDYNILEPGMVFHVSTTLRDLGHHSITASETVVITKTETKCIQACPENFLLNSFQWI